MSTYEIYIIKSTYLSMNPLRSVVSRKKRFDTYQTVTGTKLWSDARVEMRNAKIVPLSSSIAADMHSISQQHHVQDRLDIRP